MQYETTTAPIIAAKTKDNNTDPQEDLMATQPKNKKASKSGNPATRAKAQARVSSAADFKKNKSGLLELPSGAVMKVRNPGGMKVFLRDGVIPNSLMGIIQKAMDTGQQPDMSEIITPDGVTPETINDMMLLLDNVMLMCAVEPKVLPVPDDEDDRDEDLLYVDEIDEEDKMFVFQWLTGGTKDVEQFRDELAAGVADLGSIQAVDNKAKSTSRD